MLSTTTDRPAAPAAGCPGAARPGAQTALRACKARRPNFHIGESPLPADLPLFERVGGAARVRAINTLIRRAVSMRSVESDSSTGG